MVLLCYKIVARSKFLLAFSLKTEYVTVYLQIAYLFFLAIFTFFVLTDLHPVSTPNAPSIMEVITWCWTVTMVIEEVRQVRRAVYSADIDKSAIILSLCLDLWPYHSTDYVMWSLPFWPLTFTNPQIMSCDLYHWSLPSYMLCIVIYIMWPGLTSDLYVHTGYDSWPEVIAIQAAELVGQCVEQVWPDDVQPVCAVCDAALLAGGERLHVGQDDLQYHADHVLPQIHADILCGEKHRTKGHHDKEDGTYFAVSSLVVPCPYW